MAKRSASAATFRPDLSFETRHRQAGARFVAGVDEAGRGPLAGPVVAAAVILDPLADPIDGLDDSKRLDRKTRLRLFEAIHERALSVSIASSSAALVDRINILAASLDAMSRAVEGLSQPACVALIDGNRPPRLSCPFECIVKGDQRSQSIAAASIIAKVIRDSMLERCGMHHPAYGFERHAGYGTKAHRGALAAHGPVPRIHRMSFAPLKADLFATSDPLPDE